jgi:hypothetical protein
MGKWGDYQRTPKVIAANDPVTCAIYARKNGLFNQPGWKHFWHIAKNEKKFTHIPYGQSTYT